MGTIKLIQINVNIVLIISMSDSVYESTYIADREYREILERTIQYQKLPDRILARIRASVNLESLCVDTSQDICWLLGIERVAVY